MLLLTSAPTGPASEDPMPKTLTVAPVTITSVSGGTVRVRTQLVDARGTVLAEAVSADITVPADPVPTPTVATPTVTMA